MKHLALSSADRIPALGLGTWKSAPGEVGAAVETAIELGYRHLDCASIYGNEAEIGAAIARCIAAGKVTREELWVTSKLWNNAHAAEDVEAALDESLARLGLDYLDLYLIHWPVCLAKSVKYASAAADFIALEDLPTATTWAALEACVDAGKCRNIGVSNFSQKKLAALLEHARIKPAVNQVEMHPYLQQPELVTFCAEKGVVLTAYSPLGSNDRAAAFKAPDEPVLLADPLVVEIAASLGCSPAQVLLAWAIARGTSVIPKSVNPGRLAENLAAAEIVLDADTLARLAELDRGRRYIVGSFWVVEGGPYTLSNIWDA